MSEHNIPAPGAQAQIDEPKRPWTAPELRTMHAGSAEAGPTPISPEGIFALGSS